MKPYVDQDAYSIYAILLETQKHTFFVIQSETQSVASATPRDIGIKGDRKFQKKWGPVLKDFTDQLRTPRSLARNIPSQAAYELVSEQKILAIVRSERMGEAFYELYPLSGGYYWLSGGI